VEIFFICSNLEFPVLLRHEASATDETDSSFLGMTEVKKIVTESRAAFGNEILNLHFQNLSLLKLLIWLMTTVPLLKERKQKFVLLANGLNCRTSNSSP